MVYSPNRGVASRAISQNRQSISEEEEEFRRKSAAAAADRMMSGSSIQKTPSPMPTGMAAPTANTSVDALVNSAPAAARTAAGPQATMPTNTSQFGLDSGNARKGILDDIFGFLGDTLGSDSAPQAAPQSRLEVDDSEERNRDAALSAPLGDVGLGSDVALTGSAGRRNAGPGRLPGMAGARIGTGPIGGNQPSAGADLTNSGAAEDVTTPLYNDGTEDSSPNPELSQPEPNNFRSELEKLLMGKLAEDVDERAAADAGRAIAAARAQGGRGMMGMSGGMIGLQSDIATSAAERARRGLFGEQMDAARRGVQLEALDKAESLGLLQYLSTTSMSRDEAINFIQDFMDIDTQTAATIANAAIPEGEEEEDDPLAPPRTSEEEDDPTFLDDPLGYFGNLFK